ncbi:hypothetical protein I316_07033 [Kwoniella heveanensis BCC8398]|uniref:ATP-dependent DNA ligase family profile domain-containing protein n=1 Tax=Kwoniella heveanensis BCC8398 TaxID=1296120 RepID=A0A1B9GJT6_9TREE|nr:hypothetical protein I316_07033 [Kwoniella heveanensis BCC8398]
MSSRSNPAAVQGNTVTQTEIEDGEDRAQETDLQRTLRRVVELQKRVSSENSKVVKQGIIAEYPDLRELLEFVYDPDHRTNVSYGSLQKYMQAQTDSGVTGRPKAKGKNKSTPTPGITSSHPHPRPHPIPSNLIDLFVQLSSKAITGNLAKDVVLAFLTENHVLPDVQGWKGLAHSEQMETFGRLLDRNLIAGFGAKTLQDVQWLSGLGSTTGEPATEDNRPRGSKQRKVANPQAAALPPAGELAPAPGRLSSPLGSNTWKTPLHPNLASLDKFEVALGKSIDPPFDVLFKDDQATWYASRKLDGVRCLTFLDFLVPMNSDQPTSRETKTLVSVHFVSRTGKPFYSLSKLETQLTPLADLPQLKQWLYADPLMVVPREGGVVKRLILDGEVCVMRPKSEAEKEAIQPRDDGTVVTPMDSGEQEQPGTRTPSRADEIWLADDPFVEDFASTVSLMRRTDTIQHLSYFIFDVLSYTQINSKGGAVPSRMTSNSNSALKGEERKEDVAALNPTFGARIKNIRHLVSWLNDELVRRGVKEKIVKDLKQVKIGSVHEVEGMVSRAAEEGWEGLVFRKDDIYKGKRSPDIRKFKKWQDGEYVVESIDTSSMRLAVNGVFGTYEALSNVWVSHEGHRVSVGSGFTAEQRIRYAKDPEGIVGKMITVEYFSESVAASRAGQGGGDGGKSLRFPRVKMVWEEGKRGM